jgi:uncharacterized damage-inducible protein DinB
MKRVCQTLGLIAVMFVVAMMKPAAQGSGSIKADVIKDLTGLKATMDKIAKEMPEEKYSYKSTPAQRDYAAQVLHIASVNLMLGQMIGGKATPPAIDAKATKKADVIKAMDDSFDYLLALANEQTDQTMLDTVQARFLGPSTRARVFYFVVSHTQDIYGQMVVYLRLNGGVPPASQRP